MAKVKIGSVIHSKKRHDIFMGYVKINNEEKMLAVYDMVERQLVCIENIEGAFGFRYDGKTLIEEMNKNYKLLINTIDCTKIVPIEKYINEFKLKNIDHKIEWYNDNSIVDVYEGSNTDAYEYFKGKYNLRMRA